MAAVETKKKIMIVEDDFYMRDLYELQARKEGYQVYSAKDGQQAINEIEVYGPDLLLVDLMLPKLDGLSFIRKIKQIPTLRNTPVVVITNLEDPEKEKEARALGVVDYLLKVENTPQSVIKGLRRHF